MNGKSRKKILYVITKSAWGGAGKYVYDLATNLPGGDFQVFVAAGGSGPLAQKILKEAGLPYFDIKNFQRDINVFREISAYFEILFLLLKIRPDIIHVNSSKAAGITGAASLIYSLLVTRYSLLKIFTAHGWAFHESRPRRQIFLIKFFSRLTALFYAKIICVSEYDRQSAIKNHIAPKRKLITIHNGINIDEYKFLLKEAAQNQIFQMIQNVRPQNLYHENAVIIGTIGEFTKNKGQKYLIDAMKSLVTRYPLLVTLIIGWGEEISNLKSQISNLGLENNVFIIDNLPSPASYLKAFDIFVLPSLKEGLPYTLLEAGLAGIPAVGTSAGGIPEIIDDGKNGLLAKPADSRDLAEKIEELMNNEEKRKLFSSALWQKIVQEFSLGKMLSATLAAYE